MKIHPALALMMTGKHEPDPAEPESPPEDDDADAEAGLKACCEAILQAIESKDAEKLKTCLKTFADVYRPWDERGETGEEHETDHVGRV